MNAPVVLVTRDSRGETEVRWYADEADCESGRAAALVRRRELYVDGELAEDWVADIAANLFRHELRSDRNADLSWLATHHVTAGVLEPIPGRAA